MLVRQVVDSKLAQYAYLIGCPRTGEAVVIDPERDVDRYFELAASHRLRIVAAADTHIHADYLSGLREMAERGVTVYTSKEGGADWQYEWLSSSDYRYRLLGDRDTFRVGNIEFRALHTPGHTPEHLSYLVRDAGGGATEDMALASGDFVFVGDVGRPNLLETAAGIIGSMEPAARALQTSLERSFRPLPEFLQVWPGHGAGSACGKALGDVPTTTVGYELRTNPSVQAAMNRESFVQFILAGQPEPPPYFARMKRDNRRGPELLSAMPAPVALDAAAIPAVIARRDAMLLDTRCRDAFAAGHLPGWVLADLDFQFSTIAGSYVDEDTPVYLIVEESRLDEAVRALVRIGLDRIEGFVTPTVLDAFGRSGGSVVQTEVIDLHEAEQRSLRGEGRIVDVRSKAEYDLGHLPGALNIAHTRLSVQLNELPNDQPLLVHCATGARSAAAVSLLERHGYRAVGIDDVFVNYFRRGEAVSATA